MRPSRSCHEAAASAGSDTPRRNVVPMAGGQDLLTEMKEHLVEPERVVNLKSIPGLDAIEVVGRSACASARS